ncbi:RSC chromatin remodeling complex component [Komagataella phaffii CBS 7435]|uniref:Component of the RSC chromatin remodeling complex n=2 Tax=Komagataella phaffii TaxID=460519 RepID=C4R310_KOMPG|nr:Component of the RSC chromatin remodeling complex [Komagataella phaffii GS115]AOA62776.1 GQ67_01302T0 [Komagataella phaffii]CAH2447557.1 Putative RSC subunit protein [Komagataella phaffii CBS 7435]AOA66979.1 GQ68_00088T0 [Komagataella phaffii GS115]CAY69884.1 Component of the RSC chromatin remodeling complex [Komagataella phaffii GS115]CCA37748.1 RSC chromatin remodeling complex component [Komagataella phaffii CBS 7435]
MSALERESMIQRVRPLVDNVYGITDSKGQKLGDTFKALLPRSFLDYFKVIKRPMSLQKVRINLNKKKYANVNEVIYDMAQITWNAKFYNEKDSDIYKQADILEDYIKETMIPAIRRDSSLPGFEQVIYPNLGPLPDGPNYSTPITQPPPPSIPTSHVKSEPSTRAHSAAVTPPIGQATISNPHDNLSQQAPQALQFPSEALMVTTITGHRIPESGALENDDSQYPIPQPQESYYPPQAALRSLQEKKALVEAWHKRGRPPIIDKPHEMRIKNIMRSLKKLKSSQDPRRSVYNLFDRLPSEQQHSDYFSLISDPMCFNDIRQNIKQRKYNDVEAFLNDVYKIVENNRLYYASDRHMIMDVNDLENGLKEIVDIELARPEKELTSGDMTKTPMDSVLVKGRRYRVGDWVLIANPNDPRKPIVGQIFRIWHEKEKDADFVNVCWYYRAEQTVHKEDRLFYKNEVFKTGQYRDHRASEIVGPCYVAYYTRYQRGDPDFDVEGPIFICEFRFNDGDKQFNKIRTWKACLPDEVRHVEDPIIPSPELRHFPKYYSPIRYLLPQDAKITNEKPEPTIYNLNAPPLIGAVYAGPPSLDDDLCQYASSPKIQLTKKLIPKSANNAPNPPLSGSSSRVNLSGYSPSPNDMAPNYNNLQTTPKMVNLGTPQPNGLGTPSYPGYRPSYADAAYGDQNTRPIPNTYTPPVNNYSNMTQRLNMSQVSSRYAPSKVVSTPYNELTFSTGPYSGISTSSAFTMPADVEADFNQFALQGFTRVDISNEIRRLKKQNAAKISFDELKQKQDELPLIWKRGPPVYVPNRVINNEIFQIDDSLNKIVPCRPKGDDYFAKSFERRTRSHPEMEAGEISNETEIKELIEINEAPGGGIRSVPRLGHSSKFLAWAVKKRKLDY